jgi:pseudouridine-5'-phosphate glycosidase
MTLTEHVPRSRTGATAVAATLGLAAAAGIPTAPKTDGMNMGAPIPGLTPRCSERREER